MPGSGGALGSLRSLSALAGCAAGRGVPAQRADVVAGDNVFAGDKRCATAFRLCTQTPLSCANTCRSPRAGSRCRTPREGGAACDSRGGQPAAIRVGARGGKGVEWGDRHAGVPLQRQVPEGESWVRARMGGWAVGADGHLKDSSVMCEPRETTFTPGGVASSQAPEVNQVSPSSPWGTGTQIGGVPKPRGSGRRCPGRAASLLH